ncbi:ABC transporter substrate-binding protein [Haliovirga abyssi]|uniref:Iron(III)-binding protein n=1 Tax=Haliovirga abyssi TaxID=2996794 RepID=A0AAU9DW78_9FUSO|nr:ABC transporter substrate-binding protein [Haliovirga abyssi]BDU51639.1 iron(III)-binding protein [Haliovirga abyssi]
MKKFIIIILSFLSMVLFIVINFEKPEKEIDVINSLIVYSPHPLSFIEPLINKFESEQGVRVKIISKGSGELLNRIEDEKFYGDIIWGGSLSTLLPEVDYFEKYISVNEKYISEKYKNKSGRITRFTAVPSVLMVNENLVGDVKIDGFKDLLNPKLKGKIASAYPFKSSSSFEHLINQLYVMGGDNKKGWSYIKKLIKNIDGKELKRSSEVYKGVVNGKYTVGCTFEEAAANYVKNGAPIKIVYPVEGTIIRPDGVAIIKGSKNLENAKKFIDFLTSKEVQTFIAKDLNRRSVRKDVKISKGLKLISEIKVVDDDLIWVVENKNRILDKYKGYLKE